MKYVMISDLYRGSGALVLLIISAFSSCTDDDHPEEPCLFCSADFSLIDYEPGWSPDGKWIAFVHGDSIPEKTGIYLISPDGSQVQQWHDQPAEAPAWSPDGEWIAFSSGDQIWKKKVDGDSLTQLTFEGRNYYPTWSPDGKWIAFDAFIRRQSNYYTIWKMKNNGEDKTCLVPFSAETGDVRMPNWAGNAIFQIRYMRGVYSSEIFSMDANGENVQRITINVASDYYPKFSLARNKIVFTSQTINSLPQIWVISDDSSSLEPLTDTQAVGCDWSPGGDHIVYTDSRGKNGRLWVMEGDGKNRRQLTFEHHF